MNRTMSMAIVCALAISVTVSCVSGPPGPIRVDEMTDPGLGMIYGQVRVPEKDRLLNSVMIRLVGKVYADGAGEKVQVSRDGRFVAPNLKPGRYRLAGFSIGQSRDMLGKEALNHTVVVKPGGVHYLGTYDYIIVKTGTMSRQGTFDLKPDTRKATHIELLTWAEEATQKTKWHGVVKRRLTLAKKRQAARQ